MIALNILQGNTQHKRHSTHTSPARVHDHLTLVYILFQTSATLKTGGGFFKLRPCPRKLCSIYKTL